MRACVGECVYEFARRTEGLSQHQKRTQHKAPAYCDVDVMRLVSSAFACTRVCERVSVRACVCACEGASAYTSACFFTLSPISDEHNARKHFAYIRYAAHGRCWAGCVCMLHVYEHESSAVAGKIFYTAVIIISSNTHTHKQLLYRKLLTRAFRLLKKKSI